MCSANLSVTFLWTCEDWNTALDVLVSLDLIEKPFYFAPRCFCRS